MTTAPKTSYPIPRYVRCDTNQNALLDLLDTARWMEDADAALDRLGIGENGSLGSRGLKIVDAVLSLIGIPEDNTAETDACAIATTTGVWPEYGYCRDGWYTLWWNKKRNVAAFLKSVYRIRDVELRKQYKKDEMVARRIHWRKQ